MRSDESGVAGFFEDLPVLVLVLGGVALLVSSGLWSAARLAEQSEEGSLDDLAERVVDDVIRRVRSLAPYGEMLPLRSIESLNLTEYVHERLDGNHFSINISVTRATLVWSVTLSDDASDTIADTGFSHRLFNAADEDGIVLICEVRLVVWSA